MAKRKLTEEEGLAMVFKSFLICENPDTTIENIKYFKACNGNSSKKEKRDDNI